MPPSSERRLQDLKCREKFAFGRGRVRISLDARMGGRKPANRPINKSTCLSSKGETHESSAHEEAFKFYGETGEHCVVPIFTSRRADLTRLGSARLGSARLGSARLDSTRLDPTRLDLTRRDSTRLDSASPRLVRKSLRCMRVKIVSSPSPSPPLPRNSRSRCLACTTDSHG